MLRQTFLHISGVGPRLEQRIWRAGIPSWDEFPAGKERVRLPRPLAARIEEELGASEEALRRGRHRYFATRLEPREHWRAWREFRRDAVFLDIETTGLSPGRDTVTLVGVYDGVGTRSFIRGIDLEAWPTALEGKKLLVTFNGLRFDVPFLRKAFPRVPFDQIHIDLMYPLRRLGFSGGLKGIEAQLGILRSEETVGLSGVDAVRLWRAYEEGDDGALDLLLAYNREDVRNLEPLAAFAYEGLRCLCLEGGFVTADRLPPAAEPFPGRAPRGTSPRSS